MCAALGVRDAPNRSQQALGFRVASDSKDISQSDDDVNDDDYKPPGRNNRSNKTYQTMGKLLTLYVDERKNT